MERTDAEFLEICADWSNLKGVEVLCSRTAMGTWQAVVKLHDAAGIFFSPPVLAADDKRKGDTIEARRERVYTSLSRAVAAGRGKRIEQLNGRPPAAAKA